MNASNSIKTCNRCGESKQLDAFHKNRTTFDGHQYQCKSCVKKYSATTNRKEALRRHAKTAKYRINQKRAITKWKESNPEKVQAHYAVRKAVRLGRLAKAPCVICGSEDVHAHHDSYAPHRQLDVVWLCRRHHLERHKTL